MTRIHGFSATVLAVSLITAGCGGPASESRVSSEPRDLAGLDERAASPAGDELVVTGEVSEVNPEAKRFMVKVNGYDHSFAYDDKTEVIDRQGRTQGLLGLEGSPVTVSYRGAGDYWYAVRIELL
jgi:hypothetical protein